MSNKTIYLPISFSHNKENMIVGGAGKFNSEKLVLSKERASLLYIELHKWLFDKDK